MLKKMIAMFWLLFWYIRVVLAWAALGASLVITAGIILLFVLVLLLGLREAAAPLFLVMLFSTWMIPCAGMGAVLLLTGDIDNLSFSNRITAKQYLKNLFG